MGNAVIDISTQDFLAHYGVRGMKWGVRRQLTKREANIRKSREDVSARRRQISDTDLQNYINRLNNEKRLKELVDSDLHPGSTVAKKILSESGQKVARTVIAGAALYGVKLLIEKKFKKDPTKIPDIVGYIAPKPKK